MIDLSLARTDVTDRDMTYCHEIGKQENLKVLQLVLSIKYFQKNKIIQVRQMELKIQKISFNLQFNLCKTLDYKNYNQGVIIVNGLQITT